MRMVVLDIVRAVPVSEGQNGQSGAGMGQTELAGEVGRWRCGREGRSGGDE